MLPDNFNLFTYDELFSLCSAEKEPSLRLVTISVPDKPKRVLSRKYVMNWSWGMDAPEAAMFYKALALYPGTVTVTGGEGHASARSIMGLMTLAIAYGTQFTVTAHGRYAREMLDAVEYLNSNEYFHEDRGKFNAWLEELADRKTAR